MNYLRNVRVARRLGLGFGLLLLLVAAVVATGATASVVQKRAMQQVVDVSVAKVRLLSQMLDANNQMMVVRREMLIRQGDHRTSDEKRIADLVKRYEASWSAYRRCPVTPKARPSLKPSPPSEPLLARSTSRPAN